MLFDHIHLGAGRCSLGVIAPLSVAAGGRVHIVVHRGSRLGPAAPMFVCVVQAADGTRTEQPLKTESFSIAESIEELAPQARAALLESPDLLLTTALTPGGVEAQREFLVRLVEARRPLRTVVVACEEGTGAERTELLQQLEALGADVRRSVVDRLCSLDVRARRENRHAVCVDEDVAWFIEGEATTPLLQALADVPGVTFTKAIEAQARLTSWLGRGMLLQLALLAKEIKRADLRLEAIRREREGWFDRVCAALVPVVEQGCAELPADVALPAADDYARKQIASLLRHDSDGEIVLSKLKRADLASFLREVEQLIAAPCRRLVATTGELPPELRQVFFSLDIVLGDVQGHRDWDVYHAGDMLIDEATDSRVIDAYRELITGVIPDDEIEGRVISLAVALQEHRDEFERRTSAAS